MELLKKLYAIHSPSGNEGKMRRYVKAYIKKNIPDAVVMQDHAGNLYVSRGISETYPCVVAHMDQVQKTHSKDFRAVETEDIIFGYSPSKRRQEGLGADDKNGIWIALRCLRKNAVMKIALFTEEEVGCRGSSAADLDFFSDCRFVIEADRRGYDDMITQISYQEICSKDFVTDIRPERYGYHIECGLMTDVEALKERGLGISCINLSCGYYQPHSDEEFTVKKDIVNCLNFVQYIIENCTKVYQHDGWADDGFMDYWDDACYEMEERIYDIVSTHPDYSAEDAWDVYATHFPGMTREFFISQYEEYAEAYGFEIPKGRSVWDDEARDKENVDGANDSSNYSLFSDFFSGGRNRRMV